MTTRLISSGIVQSRDRKPRFDMHDGDAELRRRERSGYRACHVADDDDARPGDAREVASPRPRGPPPSAPRACRRPPAAARRARGFPGRGRTRRSSHASKCCPVCIRRVATPRACSARQTGATFMKFGRVPATR